VLFGDYNPTGKLPQTWPTSASQEPINSGDGKTGLYPFGYGLNYGGTTTTTTTTTRPTTTTTTTTRPTTTTTTTRPTTTTTTTRATTTTTSTCVGSNGTVSSVTGSSITFQIPTSTCIPQAIFTARVYSDSAGTVLAGTGSGTRDQPSFVVGGLSPNTQYWYQFDLAPLVGPVRTSTSTTTTTTRTTTSPTTCQPIAGTFLSATTTTLTFSLPNPCGLGGAPGVFIYSSADESSQIGWFEGGSTVTATGLTPGTQYWYKLPYRSIEGPVSTLNVTTTTTCQPIAGTFLSATTTTLTFSLPTNCNGGGAPGVAIYTSASATSPIGVWEGGTTATATGLTPGTQYWYRINNGSLQGPVSTLSVTTTTTTTTGGSGCTATAKVISSWTGGYQGEVTVTATSPLTAWTLTWTLASGQAIQQAWNATVTTSGSTVTAKNLSWNGTLGTGASATFGFIGSWSGSNPTPTITCRNA
jgi:hypothetical protein